MSESAKPQPTLSLDVRTAALRKAITADNTRAVHALLATGLDPRTRYEQGRTPMHFAARSGALQVLALLLAQCPPDDVDVLGNDALMLAAAYGHDQAIDLLLPVSNPRRSNNVGWSALTYALAGGHRECVEMLLPHSDLEWVDISGDDPEQVATDSGYPDLGELVRIERWWRRTRQLRHD